MPEDNISAVEFMIETVKRLIYQQIRSSLAVGISQVYQILHQYLAVRLCTRWLPHNLNDAQKLHRINWCREMMQRFADGNSNVVNDMVAGDEYWIYCYDPETKRHSAQWELFSY
ncbi:Mariner Mos1 transposase [Eumeta japonica]|uniref:Mariner Mos1 transposase n=1 Tax=Eumeta variegata TaxID=151549 RepID=A0A4C1TEM0_EUMVA|nr:Mariner Mos1 transposase [Eumeta japonica]